MNSSIENLNQWGGQFLDFAWPVLWQSSLLIGFVFGLDFLLARKIRASVRYALWLAVLVKLVLPPTLALPTGAAWWLFHAKPPSMPEVRHFTVSYSDAPMEPYVAPPTVPMPVVPPPALEAAGWALLAAGGLSAGLLLWLAIRWWQVARIVRRAAVTEDFSGPLAEALWLAGMQGEHVRAVSGVPGFRLKIVEGMMSPAVCGLFRPVILLPRALAEKLSASQLRAVLLHEIFHLRRRDVWVNCAQALLQIVYWWHPLLWAANARIRRVREEAVDDAVMLALRGEADGYAPTLLEVAKLAFRRPLMSLGLVGIMESRSALRQRIERLVNFRAPRKAGLTFASLCGIFAFSAVALPMGESPAPAVTQNGATNKPVISTVDPNFRTVLQSLKQRTGAETAGMPAAGTASGNQNGMDFINVDNTFPPMAQTNAGGNLNRVETATSNVVLATNTPEVLITAGFYHMRPADFENLAAGLQLNQGRAGEGSCWTASPQSFAKMQESLKSAGLEQISAPRMVTISGEAAQMYIGNDTNEIFFNCTPVVTNGRVSLALYYKVVEPQAGVLVTNQFSTVTLVEDHGGILVSAPDAAGMSQSNVVALVGVKIITDKMAAQFRHQLGPAENQASAEATNLHTRTFKVDSLSFISGLKQAGVDPGGNMNVTEMARNYFLKLGVNLDSSSGKAKAVFYNDRSEILFVKATEADLDLIDKAIQKLMYTTPQIHIKARFVEVPKGTFLMPSNSTLGPVTGILTSKNLKLAWNRLQATKGFEELGEPEITTLTGRQCQMRSTQIITVITNFMFQANPTNDQNSAILPQTSQVETGPVLDVVPYVLSDGYTVNLALNPSMTEFMGYATPSNNAVEHTRDPRVHLPVILPNFRIRQVVTVANVWDGQTVVLSGLPEKDYVNGKEVKSKASDKELLIFVTASIVDPAGNRVHTDAEMPFAQNDVPPQPKRTFSTSTSSNDE